MSQKDLDEQIPAGAGEVEASSDATKEQVGSVAADLIAQASEAMSEFDFVEDEIDPSVIEASAKDDTEEPSKAVSEEVSENSDQEDTIEELASEEVDVNAHVLAELGGLEGVDFVEGIEEQSEEGRDFTDLEELLADDNEEAPAQDDVVDTSATDGTELDAFESASIEEEEFLEDDQVASIIESILFATDKPQSFTLIKQAFKGTNIKSKQIRRAIDLLATEYAGARRGVTLEEITGGYQLRTKVDNMPYLKRMLKVRSFKVSGPALEVLAIMAYKQPCIKADVDEIRGVESGHLMRGLMDRGLVSFAGKSDLPGKPMYYQTTRKFLEIFGLRSLKELPSLSEIDELIPEGIDEQEEKKTLDMLTDDLSENVGVGSYSEGEEELMKISDKLSGITTSTDFFEHEKQRQREKRDAERAQDIREAMEVGEEVPNKDVKWLERYETKLKEKAEEEARLVEEAKKVVESGEAGEGESAQAGDANSEALETAGATEELSPEENPEDTVEALGEFQAPTPTESDDDMVNEGEFEDFSMAGADEGEVEESADEDLTDTIDLDETGELDLDETVDLSKMELAELDFAEEAQSEEPTEKAEEDYSLVGAEPSEEDASKEAIEASKEDGPADSEDVTEVSKEAPESLELQAEPEGSAEASETEDQEFDPAIINETNTEPSGDAKV